ncbi:hypothetical protein E4U53_003801 [Claviceps sorghi]|nr:hypothetical protein E4U53_003801 [Claviceps sorghi]
MAELSRQYSHTLRHSAFSAGPSPHHHKIYNIRLQCAVAKGTSKTKPQSSRTTRTDVDIGPVHRSGIIAQQPHNCPGHIVGLRGWKPLVTVQLADFVQGLGSGLKQG